MTPPDKYKQNIRQSALAFGLIVTAVIYALVGIARPPQGTTITNEAVSSFLFKTGQRQVARSNMTETVLQNASIAAILELTASKEELAGDGSDSCYVKAMVYDVAGNPVPDGQPVAFTTSAGTFSNGTDTIYTLTTQGQAFTWLRSVLLAGHTMFGQVEAMTYGASGQTLTKQLRITFYAAGIRGRIVSAVQRTVHGIIVVAYDPANQEAGRDTVSSSGGFFIPLEHTNTYTIAFRYKSLFDDDMVLYASASVQVPATGGVAAISPLNSVVGNLIDALTGKPVRKSGISVIMYQMSSDGPRSGRSMPALQMTDDRGIFAFDSLAPGVSELNVIDVRYSGKLPVQHTQEGVFVLDANIALAEVPKFEVVKTSNKRVAELGDAITYNVEIRNTSQDSPLLHVQLVDELPLAFVYARNSARVAAARLAEPANNRKLEWLVADSLMPGKSISVTYSVNTGAGALESNGINKAYAVALTIAGQTVRTAQSSVQVTIRPGVFTDRGIVIGKIFYDGNENGQQEDGEQGIAGVELWMEDGTRVTTGDDGKYSLPEVRPGQHVLRVNQLTLPVGSELLALKSESAGDGLTRFVRLTDGGIARTDFYVRAPHQAALAVIFAKRIARTAGEEIPAMYVIQLHDIGSPTKVSLIDTLPTGFRFDLKSIIWRNMKLQPDGAYAHVLSIEFPKRPANSADTIRLTIVPDSAAVGGFLLSNGKLSLSYANGRSAIFHATTTFGLDESPREEPAHIDGSPKEAPAQVKDSVKVVAATPTHQVSDTLTDKKAEPKKAVSRTGVAKRRDVRKATIPGRDTVAKSRNATEAGIDSSGALNALPQAQAAIEEKVESGATPTGHMTTETIALISAGVIVLLALLGWWLIRRRKNTAEGSETL